MDLITIIVSCVDGSVYRFVAEDAARVNVRRRGSASVLLPEGESVALARMPALDVGREMRLDIEADYPCTYLGSVIERISTTTTYVQPL